MLPQPFDVEVHMHGLGREERKSWSRFESANSTFKTIFRWKARPYNISTCNQIRSSPIYVSTVSFLNKVLPQPFDVEMHMHGLGREKSKSWSRCECANVTFKTIFRWKARPYNISTYNQIRSSPIYVSTVSFLNKVLPHSLLMLKYTCMDSNVNREHPEGSLKVRIPH